MVEVDGDILAWMEFGLRLSRSLLEKMPLYVKRGHYPPEKLAALRQVVIIETRGVAAYRDGKTNGLSPVDKIWLEYLYGWACVKVKQYAGIAQSFDSYREEFQALWDRRDAKLVALGVPAYGENYSSG